jgi:hypothetical protein
MGINPLDRPGALKGKVDAAKGLRVVAPFPLRSRSDRS